MEDYMSIFTGSGTAIVTPMNADGSVNFEKFAELIEFQVENGTDAIIVCGTTGESAAMPDMPPFGDEPAYAAPAQPMAEVDDLPF